MSEIKLRAWDGVKLHYSKIEFFDDSVNFRFEHFAVDGVKPVLERCTGLYDKNGKEAYEGDIYTACGNGLYEIRFISGSFCGGLLGEWGWHGFAPLGWESQDADEDLYVSIDFFKFMEIIGNIHDNPELLEVVE